MHHALLFLASFVSILPPDQTTASATEHWSNNDPQSTFLDRYHRHTHCNHPTSTQTCASRPDWSPPPRPALPTIVQNIFRDNLVEIAIEPTLSTKAFKANYFLQQPVLVQTLFQPRPAAFHRWRNLTYLQGIAAAEQLRVRVGTSRRIVQNGGDGKWLTPLSTFIHHIERHATQHTVPLYAFDRGHLLSTSTQLTQDVGATPSFFKHSERTSKQRANKYANESWFRDKEDTLQYFLMTAGPGSGVQPHAHSDG
jgi:hypothetical protein